MHLRLQLEVHHNLYASGGTLVVRSGDELGTIVHIHYKTNADNQKQVRADALAEVPCPDEIREEVEMIIDGTIRFWVGGPKGSDALTAFAERYSAQLAASAKRVLEVARWRFAASTPDVALYPHSFWIGEDLRDWHWVPTERQGYASTHKTLPLNRADAQSEVEKLLQSGAAEPVGHALRREARGVAMANPRSALVIGLAALEAGFKALVVNLTPDAQWLAENAPSPPLVKMLTDYLPTMPTRHTFDGQVHPIPKAARKLLGDAVLKRNRVVHVGSPAFDDETTKDVLQCVSDTLYLFDYYAGHEWAIDYLSKDYRDALGS